jgi:hypothetical protein
VSHQASGWATAYTRPLGASKNGWALRKLLLLLIANHAAPCGVAWIAQRRLVEETEVNRGTVITALSDLEQCGSIRRIERRRPNGSRTSDIIILAPDGDRGGMVTPQQDDLPEGVWVPLMNAGIFGTTNVASSNVASANVGQLPNPQKSRAADSLVLSEPVATHREGVLPLFTEPSHASAPEPAHTRAGQRCAWERDPAEYEWFPTYTKFDETGLAAIAADDGIWREPDPVRLVIDFWRDLSWHFDAAATPEKVRAVKVALKAYPLDQTLMVLRAVVGGLNDPWRREHNYDDLTKIIAIIPSGADARDNVDRYGTPVGEEQFDEHIRIATDNRRYSALLRAGEFQAIDETWRFDHRKRLERQMRGSFNRYMAWKAEAARSGVR